MAEQTEWKPEKIISWEDIKDFEVPYWLKQWKLIPWIHYTESSQESNIYVWNVTYTTTWVKTISWIWFTPTMIKIHGGINGGNTWYSDWYYFSSTIYCQYVYFNVGVGTVWNTTSYSSYVQIWGNASSSTTITPTSDWFTINVNDVSAGTLQISYECYQ